MKNKLLKPMLWLFAIVATTSAYSGQQVVGNNCCNPCDSCCEPCECPCPPNTKPFDQGYELCSNNMMGAYNAPARIDVCGSWDFFVDVSFIYWHASEEALEPTLSDSSPNGLPIVNGQITQMDFKYEPGFKVGIGYNLSCHDDWQFYVGYTRLHFDQSVSTTSPALGVLYPLQSHPAFSSAFDITFARESWNVDIDLIDFEMARPHYVGTMLVFRPFIGLRAQWIDQKLNTRYSGVTGIPGSTLQDVNFRVLQDSKTWAVGPRVGLDSNWLLGCGFRLIGNIAGSIVYTKYTTLNYKEKNLITDADIINVGEEQNVLRAILEFQSGLGYGLYFCNNAYHFDISATYDFHHFWNQNAYRNFVSAVAVGKSFSNYANLYLHGLTLTVRFDF
jgi:Legionella pneumophila major outer membrane protein precursor